ncbi:thioredoxin family protein [Mycoplasmatota bacterium]|nr:thioredoxin family protein [Mycoplasmatota bacterium]
MNDITQDDLNQALKRHDNCVVLVYTNMCGTCESAKIMLDIVSKTMKHLLIYQLNVNHYPNIIEDYHITSIPCFLLFKEGKLVEQFYAFHSVTFLYQKFMKIFNDIF